MTLIMIMKDGTKCRVDNVTSITFDNNIPITLTYVTPNYYTHHQSIEVKDIKTFEVINN